MKNDFRLFFTKMPEGPEVTIMCDYVRTILCQPEATLKDVTFISGKYLAKPPKHYLEYKNYLQDQTDRVKSVNKKGKFSWWEMESGWKISITFGMSGMFKQEPTEDSLEVLNRFSKKKKSMEDICKHFRTKIIVSLPNDKEETFYYQDMRSFGTWEFFPPGKDIKLQEKINKLGYDIIDLNISDSQIVANCRIWNSKSICKLLMEQSWPFSGIGNYLKAEILYRCKVNPYAKVYELDDDILVKIARTGHELANTAYSMGGTSLILFSGHDYQEGGFHTKLLVYDKKKDPLGNPVIQDKKTDDKRTTWWVKEVQTIGVPPSKN